MRVKLGTKPYARSDGLQPFTVAPGLIIHLCTIGDELYGIYEKRRPWWKPWAPKVSPVLWKVPITGKPPSPR